MSMMALSLKLRKFHCLRCLLCQPPTLTSSQPVLSYGQLQYIVQRCKNTASVMEAGKYHRIIKKYSKKMPFKDSGKPVVSSSTGKNQETELKIGEDVSQEAELKIDEDVSQEAELKIDEDVSQEAELKIDEDVSQEAELKIDEDVSQEAELKIDEDVSQEAELKIDEDVNQPQESSIKMVSLKDVMTELQADLLSRGKNDSTEPMKPPNKKVIKTNLNDKKIFIGECSEKIILHSKDRREKIIHSKDSLKRKKKIIFASKNALENTPSIETSDMYSSLGLRKNAISIQTLSSSLHGQLFKNIKPRANDDAEEDLKEIKKHLEAHGLWGRPTSVSPDFDFKIPELVDHDLDQHFRIIAEDQCGVYKTLLNRLVGANLPECPLQWKFTPGWTRYNSDGSSTQVDYPDCQALVFDVEVCMSEGSHPTLATAVSDKYWYSWCSDQLIDPQNHCDISFRMENLIPMETPKDTEGLGHGVLGIPRIIVGHNVSYDRIRVREQYFLEGTSTRFVDTMSLHIAVSGLVSEQRALVMKNKTSAKSIRLPWMNVGCQNSLNEVYKFYCKLGDLEKSTRDTFVKGSLDDVLEDFQNLMNYCAGDVKATHMVLVKLLPLFFKRFPHPVTFAGMLEMGQTFLPVTENWNKYIKAAEKKYHEVEHSLNEELVKQTQVALGYMDEMKYKHDLWLWNLDWSLPKGRVKKLAGHPNWYRKLCAKTGQREGTPEPENMSTSLQVVPKLLRLTWEGFPLHYERDHGWGYLKPVYDSFDEIPESEMFEYNSTTAKDQPIFPVKALYDMIYGCTGTSSCVEPKQSEEKDDIPIGVEEWEEFLLEAESQAFNKKFKKKVKQDYIDIGIPGVGLVPLPHKDGVGNRVGNPLAKDFLAKIEDQTLSSFLGDVAELVLKTNKSLSYWKNNRDRILSQLPIWLSHNHLPKTVLEADEYSGGGQFGVILPQVVSAGTITRRAVERTWMTASNAYADRIGSELKAMVEAPPGYKFVGADVDSQELWIAGLLGDAYFVGEHGGTALGWMMLQGRKADATDMHSRTAATTGVSRDNAKVINYGRIYGAGLKFMQRLLKQFNPSLSEVETRQRAEQLFSSTKGERAWYPSPAGRDLMGEVGFSYNGEPLTRNRIVQLLRQAREHNIEATFSEVTETPPVWVGGSESHMFNCLEAIARSEVPRTPVLGAMITRALQPWCVDDQFMTSRVNWVVQSSAVDYLHIMLVCMRWLLTKYQISGRFCISIHDEVRYMVTSDDCHRAALALQLTNLLTRSYFALRLGFQDLPQSVAFFSGVDIDQVLRKEPHLDCVTPSNPLGLHQGYGIPPGVTLDMQQIMDITQGDLTKKNPDVNGSQENLTSGS